jgi:putative transposase
MTNLKVYAGKINRRKVASVGTKEVSLGQWHDIEGNDIDSQHLLISMLLPSAVKHFLEELETEVNTLCGKRYLHGDSHHRWGRQAGSIVLGNQQVRIEKPRVRSKLDRKELALKTYQRFQDPALFEEQVFAEGLKKVSQRDYQKGMKKISASFGFTKSSISRKWVKVTAEKLKELNDRDLSRLKIMGIIIDGKRFRSRGVVVALGIGEDGKKTVLGVYECNTENSSACLQLLENLEKRGLPVCG